MYMENADGGFKVREKLSISLVCKIYDANSCFQNSLRKTTQISYPERPLVMVIILLEDGSDPITSN